MSLRGHLRTAGAYLGRTLRPSPSPPWRPWEGRVVDPRLGALRLSGRLSETPGAPAALVILHGLGGSSASSYMSRAATLASALGLTALRLDLRGADQQGEDFYHAGLTADLAAAVGSPELASYRCLLVLGHSLGGHIALRYAAEPGDGRLAAVAALCAPLDLDGCARAIDAPAGVVYRHYLLGTLKATYAAVARRRAVPTPLERIRRVRRIREWDDLTVAPRFGFADAADYYARESVGPRLGELRVPSLLVVADDDPMVPAATLRPWLERGESLLEVLRVRHAGHLAFPRRPAGGDGVEAETLGWLAAHSRDPFPS